MLMDDIRTNLYRDAILKNPADFKDKIVMDVGTGSGILAIFAAQAGAKKVYAIEASSIYECTKILVEANGFGNIIEVINSTIEEIP